jgi:O-antigen ligase
MALYVLLCYTLMLAGLALRDGRAAGWGLGGALPPVDAPVATIAPLGVTVQLDGMEPAARRAALTRLAASGIGWVRLRVDWAAIEPQPGSYNWQAVGDQLAAITSADLQAVVLLDGSPAWARASSDRGALDQPLAPPQNPADFAAFAAAFAQRFGESVRFYQVWDEPNIAPHWGNRHIDPVGYAQLLNVTAAALRRTDADAVIVSAALAPTRDRGHLAIDERFFLQRMLAAGAASSFDALALQPFGFGSAPTHSRQVIDQLDFQRTAILRRTLEQAGLAQTPVWAMRFGWNVRGDSPWSTVTPADQQRYAAEARAVTARWPWLATLGWAIDQPAAPAADPIWGFALDNALLLSLTATPPVFPAPAPGRAVRDLAIALSLCALTLIVAAYTARPLPWQSWRQHLAATPAWLEALLWGALLTAYYFATWPPLIGLCWLGIALLMMTRPQAGVWLALLLLPFYFQHKEVALVDGMLQIPPATATALALLPAVARAISDQLHEPAGWRTWARSHLIWSDGLAAAWLLINLATLVNVWQVHAYAQGLLELAIVPLILYTAIRIFVRDAQALRAALVALFGGGLLVALFGLVRWLQGQGVEVDGVRRLVGAYYSPNQTALTLLRALFVGLGLALGMHGQWRTLWLAPLGILTTALLLTASRGALLLGIPAGFATALGLWLLRGDDPVGVQLRGLRRRRSVRILLMLGPLVLLAAFVVGEARLLNHDSVDNRLLLWRTALALWRDFPLLGVGPNGFYWRYPAYLPLGATLEPSLRHPHNVWLELGTGWGVLGLLWLAGLLAGWLTQTARRLTQMLATLQWPAIGLAAALVAALAHAQVDALLALPDQAGWLFAALALAAQITAAKKTDSGA